MRLDGFSCRAPSDILVNRCTFPRRSSTATSAWLVRRWIGEKTVGLKVFIEEIALAGIPSVIVDPQGTRSSSLEWMKKVLLPAEATFNATIFGKNTEVRVWTPVRSKGLPLCLNPFVAPSDSLDEEQLISSWDLMAAGFTPIAGFNLAKPEEQTSKPTWYR